MFNVPLSHNTVHLKKDPLVYFSLSYNTAHLKKLSLSFLCHCLKILSTLNSNPLVYFAIVFEYFAAQKVRVMVDYTVPLHDLLPPFFPLQTLPYLIQYLDTSFVPVLRRIVAKPAKPPFATVNFLQFYRRSSQFVT